MSEDKLILEKVLAPCPCCRGKAEIDTNLCDVHCTNCGLTTGVRFRLHMAVVVWNTRVDTNGEVAHSSTSLLVIGEEQENLE
jgi:hypothetical protein